VDLERTPYQEVLLHAIDSAKGGPLAFLIPIVGGPLIFTAQCLGVTHFDVIEARIVFLSSSFSDALRALLFLFLPFTIEVVGLLASIVGGHYIRHKHWTRALYWVAGGLAATLVGHLFRSGPHSIRVSLITLGLIGVFGFCMFWGWFLDASRRMASAVLVGLAVALLLIPPDPWLFSATMWLPLERFQTESGQFSGYLLKTTEDHWLILADAPRQTFLIDKRAVTARSLCKSVDVCSEPIRPKR
jgi:hypothetical protein